MRCASTSCISLAIRVRSAIRAVFMQPLIGLRPQGTLLQGEEKLLSRPDEDAPRRHGEGQWSDLHEHRQGSVVGL